MSTARPRSIPEKQLERWSAPGAGAAYRSRRFRAARRERRDARLLLDLLRRYPLSRARPLVLDVPCGAGRLWSTASAIGPLVGVDLSMPMLQAGMGRRLRASAWALPFPARSFDLLICCRLLHHLREASSREDLLRELARVGRERVLLSFWDRASWNAWRRRAGWRRSRPLDPRVAISRRELCELARAAGLRPLGFAASARFLSPQTFCAFAVEQDRSHRWQRSR